MDVDPQHYPYELRCIFGSFFLCRINNKNFEFRIFYSSLPMPSVFNERSAQMPRFNDSKFLSDKKSLICGQYLRWVENEFHLNIFRLASKQQFAWNENVEKCIRREIPHILWSLKLYIVHAFKQQWHSELNVSLVAFHKLAFIR